MKILLINNEKNGLTTEWLTLLKNKVLEVEGTMVDILPYNVLGNASEYNREYDAIILGGREIDWDIDQLPIEYQAEIALIKESKIPILGICAGHELIGISFGAVMARMHNGGSNYIEKGFVDLFTEEDQIFQNLVNPCSVYMFHGDELKSVPNGFVKIARSELCNICGICHSEKLIYGIQFHPEKYNDEFPDGKIIMRNFIRLAYEHNKNKSSD